MAAGSDWKFATLAAGFSWVLAASAAGFGWVFAASAAGFGCAFAASVAAHCVSAVVGFGCRGFFEPEFPLPSLLFASFAP